MRKLKFLSSLVFITGLSSISLFAKPNVDNNDVNFEYIRLPLFPIDGHIRNYDVDVIQNAEAKNVAIKEAYSLKQKDADEKYQQDLKAQEDARKSQTSKLGALLVASQQMEKENRVQRITVPEPIYLKVYPKEAVASKINIAGFKRSTTDAAKVIVNLLGFESTDIEISKVTESNLVVYKYSFQYKNPVNVKVEKDGKVYFDETIAETNNYSTYTSGSFKSEDEARNNWNMNSKSISEQIQNTTSNNAFKAVNAALNNKFGYVKMSREAVICSVKNKKGDYNDYAEAYTALTEGLMSLSEESLIEEGKKKIKEAYDKYELILKESDLKDKSARVNEELTIVTYFSLLESAIWLNEFAAGQKYILKLKTSDLGWGQQGRLTQLIDLLKDQKERFDANNS